MAAGRKTIKIATLTTLTTGMFGLMAAPAFAHGYVDSPASRQAQCAAGTVSCGEIKYEPQSVEGPKGQQSCSAGLARFAELDDDGKGWQAADVATSTDFTWKYTARHRTENWQYFIDGDKIAEFDGGNAQPGESTTHKLDLSGHSGRQTILAVWNIGDTTNAFYSCVDVNIGGGSAGAGSSADAAGDTSAAAPADTQGHHQHHGSATLRAENVSAEEEAGSTPMVMGGLFAAILGVGIGKIVFNRRKRPETYREL